MSDLPADRRWLARAIALGESARGQTSPNPAVGCVLVAADRNVGEGATRPAGGSHAEVVALDQAGPLAAGATAYVTLEPCAHQGRTPPCVDALLAARVGRVVVATPDPNPLARGGVQRLRDAGVPVEVLPASDPYRQVVEQQLEGFLTTVRLGRPHVTLKLAQTTAGAVSLPSAGWVTGAEARRAVHRWRAEVDGVLVGIGTVLADDPSLDVRHVSARGQPRPIILDTRLRTPKGARVARPGTIVVSSDLATPGARASLLEVGVEIAEVPRRDDHLDLTAALRALSRVAVTSVLAEPGPRLAQALLDADLVDRLVLHVADHGGGTVVVPAVRTAPDTGWTLERSGGAGPDLILQLRRDRDAGLPAPPDPAPAAEEPSPPSGP